MPGSRDNCRNRCTLCGLAIDAATVERFAVPCNVRRFSHEVFHVWRCSSCRTLHCLEVVDLARYYAHYPLARQTLLPPLRAAYANLVGRLVRRGLERDAALLDYGCNKGLLLRYLRESGYTRCAGYDRYSPRAELRSRAALKPLAYDCIVLQDVLEHVEEPRALLAELDGYLRPGGMILIGTPNAGNIDPADVRTYWNELHPPYHLHCFTRAGLETLGAERGWVLEEFYDRGYLDLGRVGLSERALLERQWLGDGTIDAALEVLPAFRRPRPTLRLRLARWLGYWWSPKGNMAGVFRKRAAAAPSPR